MYPKKGKAQASKPTDKSTKKNSKGAKKENVKGVTDCASSTVKVVSNDGNEKDTQGSMHDGSAFLDSSQEVKVKYKKRQITSNWTRYEEDDEVGNRIQGRILEESSNVSTFEQLVSKGGTTGCHFQFKDEKEWSSEEETSRLVLNLDEVAKELHSNEISPEQRLFLLAKNTACDQRPECKDTHANKWYGDDMNSNAVNSQSTNASVESDPFKWQYDDLLNIGISAKIVKAPSQNVVVHQLTPKKIQHKSFVASEQTPPPFDELDVLLAIPVNQLQKPVLEDPKSKENEDEVLSEENTSSIDRVNEVRMATPCTEQQAGLSSEKCTFHIKENKVPSPAQKPEESTSDLEEWLDEILN